MLKTGVQIFVLIFLTACYGGTKSIYNQNAVDILQIERVNGEPLKIYYNTMSETLYYCPGANITEGEDSISIEFVRCSIDDKCMVTHPAKRDSKGEFIIFNNTLKLVFLKWGNGEAKAIPMTY